MNGQQNTKPKMRIYVNYTHRFSSYLTNNTNRKQYTVKSASAA